MGGELTIKVVERDDDYLGIDIRAVTDRFAGSARIYAGLDELTEFADHIAGFPRTVDDERTYEFGSRDAGVAGGFCSLRFHCTDGSGHARVDAVIEDDAGFYEFGSASFSFQVFAHGIDQFASTLRKINNEKSGEASLVTR